jgi:hypothetical protein
MSAANAPTQTAFGDIVYLLSRLESTDLYWPFSKADKHLRQLPYCTNNCITPVALSETIERPIEDPRVESTARHC